MANILWLAFKVNNAKLDTKFAEAKKEPDNSIETISNLLTTVSSLTEANRSLTEENTQLKEDLPQLEYHQRRNNIVFDGIPEENCESDQGCYQKIWDILAAPWNMNVNEIYITQYHWQGHIWQVFFQGE